MIKFNDEGISKVSGVIDEVLPDIKARLKAVREASKDYDTFSGKSEDMEGSVKFIYMTDGIE